MKTSVTFLTAALLVFAHSAHAQGDCARLSAIGAPIEYSAQTRGEYGYSPSVLVQDVYLRDRNGTRIKAFVVRPRKEKPVAATLFIHLLGPPPDNDREEFFADAVALGEKNVMSLLVDAPWAEPEWFTGRKLEDDFSSVPVVAAQLRGQLAWLRKESAAPPDRVAIVAHDFGAMYGSLVLANEPVRHAVVMAAVPDFSDWFLLGRKLSPGDSAAYRKRMSALAPSQYLRCSKADVLFQFAENDRFVSRDQANAFVNSAPAGKKVEWYPGGHELQDASRASRLTWLSNQLGITR